MQFDSDPIGIYVFGGVVIAGTAVAVIVDMLRKNNDHLWEIATELKFRNDAADARIKQLEFANAEAVAYANAQAEAVAMAVAPVAAEPAVVAGETPVNAPAEPESKPVELPLPGGKIDLTPSPEKIELKVAGEAKSVALEQALPAPAPTADVDARLDRRERRERRGMSPAVAAIANLVEARLAGPRVTEKPALRIPEFAAEIPISEPVVEVTALEVEAVKLDPSKTLKIPIPVAAEGFSAPALAEVVSYLELRLSSCVPQLAEMLGMELAVSDLPLGVILPPYEVNILPTLEAPAVVADFAVEPEFEPPALAVAAIEVQANVFALEAAGPAPEAIEVLEVPAEAPLVALPVPLQVSLPLAFPAVETEREQQATPLEVAAVSPVGEIADAEFPYASLVSSVVQLHAEAPVAPAAGGGAAFEAVGFELAATGPEFHAEPQGTVLEEVAALVEPDPAMADVMELGVGPTIIETIGQATPMLDEIVATLEFELTAAAPYLNVTLIPTLVAAESATAERRKNWSKILGGTAVTPASEATLVYRPKLTELPAGFHPVSILRQAADSRLSVTGMVLAIGVESSDPGGNEEVARFVQSLIQGRDFACQTDIDEFLLVCPPDQRPSSQRKLGAIAEKLWDFQLSSMGTLDVQFCWGGFEARGVSVTEAVNAALDQMRETRNERRMAHETRAAVS